MSISLRFSIAATIIVASATLGQELECVRVDPTTTGPGIVPVDEVPDAEVRDLRHIACIDKSLALPEFIMVFVPGAGALPEDYETFITFCAAQGYAAVGIAYPNVPAVNELLRTTPDLDPVEAELLRRNRLYGEPGSSLDDVDVANSIVNRIARLLIWLDDNRSGEGWGRFIDRQTFAPQWQRIIFAGHSQGSGYIAYTMKERRTAGSLIFAGPGDSLPDVGTAPWVFRPNIQPITRSSAFTHIDDPIVPGAFVRQRELGLDVFGDLQLVDGAAGATLTSHMLVTTLTPPDGAPEHRAVVADGALPLDPFGRPLYEDVWTYMLDLAAGSACAADLNGDGTTSPLDLVMFQNGQLADETWTDWDGNGVLNNADRASFVSDLLAGCVDDCATDRNGDGMSDIIDLLDFLGEWFDVAGDILDLLNYLAAWFEGC